MASIVNYNSNNNVLQKEGMIQNIKIFENNSEIAEELASILKKLAANTSGKAIHIALSGGSTPKAIFEILNQQYGKELAYHNLHFWWGDDRCVPPTHNDSNYKWANDLWLKPSGFSAKQIHRVMGENEPNIEAKRYSSEIERYVEAENNIPVFDLILLGMGDDGHTASIFPNQMELLTKNSLCEVAIHPQSGQKRISFTGKLINHAQHVIFLATGRTKAKKVHEVIEKRNANLPATHIKPTNGVLSWWLDSDSAKFIKQ